MVEEGVYIFSQFDVDRANYVYSETSIHHHWQQQPSCWSGSRPTCGQLGIDYWKSNSYCFVVL